MRLKFILYNAKIEVILLLEHSSFINFPHSLWGLVESYSNLTPRGLQYPVSSSEILESFLMPNRREDSQKEYEYMLFVWNGNTANSLIKSIALSNAFELEAGIKEGEEEFLKVINLLYYKKNCI